MTRYSLHVAILAVRAWTRIYTWRLPQAIRESRLAEIESDLWESLHDNADGAASASQVLARLFFGLPDDLAWRAAHSRRLVAAIGTIAATVFVLAALFLVDLGRARRLPVPPRSGPSLLRPIPSVPNPLVHVAVSPQ